MWPREEATAIATTTEALEFLSGGQRWSHCCRSQVIGPAGKDGADLLPAAAETQRVDRS